MLEEKILHGEAERVAFVDPLLEDIADGVNEDDGNDAAGFGDHHVSKLVTVALIKPDLTASQEKIEEILQKIEDNGLEIIADEEKVLSIEEARQFYCHRKL